MINVFWKRIPGYTNYEVSNTGLVRSLPRAVDDRRGYSRPMQGVQLKPQTQTSGHLSVSISKDGVISRKLVHLLVMLAFEGPRPDGMETRHLDGDPKNNCKSNLAYGTRQQNALDCYVHSTSRTGERSHLAKYSDVQIEGVRQLKDKCSSYEASQLTGIPSRHIRRVWQNVNRAHDA